MLFILFLIYYKHLLIIYYDHKRLTPRLIDIKHLALHFLRFKTLVPFKAFNLAINIKLKEPWNLRFCHRPFRISLNPSNFIHKSSKQNGEGLVLKSSLSNRMGEWLKIGLGKHL